MVVEAGNVAWLLLCGASVAGVVYAVNRLVDARGEAGWALIMLLVAITYPWQFLLGTLQARVINGAIRRMETQPQHLTHTIGSVVLAWNHLLWPIDWLPILIVFWVALRRQRQSMTRGGGAELPR